MKYEQSNLLINLSVAVYRIVVIISYNIVYY